MKSEQMALKDSREDPVPNNIVFSAYNDVADVYGGSYLSFANYWTSSEHFDLGRGEFIAPVTGNYQFMFTSHFHADAETFIQPQINGGKLTEFRAANDHDMTVFSTSWVVSLIEGDAMRIILDPDTFKLDLHGSLHILACCCNFLRNKI